MWQIPQVHVISKESRMPRLPKSAPIKKKRATMKKEMDLFKAKELHSGSKKGPVVTNPKQAIAIGLSVSGQSHKKPKRGHRAKKMRAALKRK